MTIDHIFIFTTDNGQVADELVEFGLTEGSSRIHPGQGTTNRKFYFDNFFLEVLWVHDEAEIKSEAMKTIGLFERSAFHQNEFSRFGLCLVNDDDTDKLFENAADYQPSYFPEGMKINYLKNDLQPSLPWTFRLPFKGQKKTVNEPTDHKNGIIKLTKASFSYTHNVVDQYVNHFQGTKNISFHQADQVGIRLTFDHHAQGLTKVFDRLNLTIEY